MTQMSQISQTSFSNVKKLYSELENIIVETKKIVGKRIEGSNVTITNEQFMKIHTGDDVDNLLNISSFSMNQKSLLLVASERPSFTISELIHILSLHKDKNIDVFISYNGKHKQITDGWVGGYNGEAVVVFET